jgi:hypothetical protein
VRHTLQCGRSRHASRTLPRIGALNEDRIYSGFSLFGFFRAAIDRLEADASHKTCIYVAVHNIKECVLRRAIVIKGWP